MILRSGFLGMAEAQAAYREGIQAAQRSRICTGGSVSVAHFRDWIVRGLDDPPKALGAANVSGLGVSGALTTEH